MIHRLINAAIRAAARAVRARARPEPSCPELILTMWQRRLLASNWVDLLEGFDAVSLKCVDGPKPYRRDDLLLMLSRLEDRGLAIHGWGYHYCRSVEEAEKEARAAADACLEHGMVAYHFNAEKHWAESADPQRSAMAFAEIFRSMAPKVRLLANCFNAQATPALLDHFDAFEPMCYGTKVGTIARKIENRMGRTDIPSAKKAIMVGTGRRDDTVKGRAWGYIEGDGESPGLLGLIATHSPVSVNFYRGGRAGGEDIMVTANSINPTLSQQALRIRAFLDEKAGIVA